ncbi:MAG: hypothetical protein KJ941_04020 [Bacteroidetes bacterium]|nr:hypothetical protein [Bacteroidota bacterium]
MKNKDKSPLIRLYRESVLENAHLLTRIPSNSCSPSNGNEQLPTLLDLLFTNSLNQTNFRSDSSWFTATSSELSEDVNEYRKLQGKLESFHKSNGNWSAYRNYVAFRTAQASIGLTFEQKIKGFEIWAKEFSSTQNENYFQLQLASLYVNSASQYHFETNTKVENDNIKALKIIDAALLKWPNRKGDMEPEIFNDQLINLRESIVSILVDFSWPVDAMLGKSNLTRLKYKNTEKINFRVYYLEEDQSPSENFLQLPLKRLKLREAERQTLEVTDKKRHLYHTHDFLMSRISKAGFYLVLASHDEKYIDEIMNHDTLYEAKNVVWKWMKLSDLSVETSSEKETVLVHVVSRLTGKPIQKATVYHSMNPLKKGYIESGLTDKDGLLRIKLTSRAYIKIVNGNDSIETSVYPRGRYEPSSEMFKLYTDRGIYRPGQKVEITVLSLKRSGYTFEMSGDTRQELIIKDNNNQELFKQFISTNSMGSAYASFILPNSILPGDVRLFIGNSYLGMVQVEEYKRPTFEVKWNPAKGYTKINEPVTLTGKVNSYAGYPIANSEVVVTISEQRYFPRFCVIGFNQRSYDTTIYAKTDKNVIFSINYFSQKPKETSGIYLNFEAKVINTTGETQFDESFLFLGKEGFEIGLRVDSEIIDGENEMVLFNLSNSSGSEIPMVDLKVKIERENQNQFTLYSIEKPEFSSIRKRKLKRTNRFLKYENNEFLYTAVWEKNIKSTQRIDLDSLNLGPGRYAIQAKTINEVGDEVSTSTGFVIIHPQKKKNQHETLLFAILKNLDYQLGETAEIILGSAVRKQSILKVTEWPDGKVTTETIKLKKRKIVELKLDEATKQGVNIRFGTTLEGTESSESIFIKPKTNEPVLKWQWIVTSDKTKPQTVENWEFQISDQFGKPYEGEALLTMYDKSLDQLANNKWELPNTSYNWSPSYWNTAYYNSFLNSANQYPFSFLDRGIELNMDSEVSFSKVASAVAGNSIMEEIIEFSDETESKKDKGNIRTNFSETAFYIPQLSIKEGKGSFSFTIPDALTTFGFKGVFHTKTADFVLENKDLIVQKELLVDTYEPRFFRTGDVLEWRMTVQNLSDKEQVVQPILLLSNVAGEDISGNFGVQKISPQLILSKEAHTFVFALKIPEITINEVQFKIGASSKEFGDFIQKSIPVLSNKETYTYGESFVVEGPLNESLKWDFAAKVPASALIQQAEIHAFSSEEVLIFKELTKLFFRKNDLNESYMAQVYAACMAENTLKINPALKNYLTEYLKKHTPKGNLQKNWTTEALALTPWLEVATSEENYLQSFALLLDEVALINYKQQAINALRESQLENGAWSWVGKEYANRTVTLDFLNQLVQLKSKGITVLETATEKALGFIEEEFNNDFKRLTAKEKEQNNGVSPSTVQWLYARTVLKAPMTAASDYYLLALKAKWVKMELENWAIVGKLAKKLGNSVWAEEVLAALEDTKIAKQKQGEFWNFSDNTYYGNTSGLEAQLHTIGFYESMEKFISTRKMRQWVIQQKQSSNWNNIRTIGLANATLLEGKKPQETSMEIGWVNGVKDNNDSQEFVQIDKNPERKLIVDGLKINQMTDNNTYVDLTVKYTASVSDIVKSNSDFRVERQYYLISEGKEILLSEVKKAEVKVGDRFKVVLKLITPNAMSYVYIADPRFSGQENLEPASGFRYSDFAYYVSQRDQKTEFFIEYLPKGTNQLSYDFVATTAGTIQVPAAKTQSYYQPQKVANSAYFELKVAK